METMIYSLLVPFRIITPVLYGVALFSYWLYFLNGNQKIHGVGYASVAAAVLLHIVFLIGRGLQYGHFPITSTYESFSMIALSIAIIYLMIEKIRHEGKTGLFFIGIAFLFQFVASLFISEESPHNLLLANPIFGIHTLFTLLGLTALAISALYGLMYWMLAKEIKAHRFGKIYTNLPPLESVEDLGRTASLIGLILLGLGILLGHYMASLEFGHFFILDAKMIVADLAWLAYSIGWIFVVRYRLSGLRMSRIAFWGFLIFFISMIFINIFGDTFHKFG
jgi:HemX protein